MHHFNLHVTRLLDIAPVDPQLDRKQQIRQRKEQIYAYRNHYLSRLIGRQIQSTDYAQTRWGKPYFPDLPLAFNHSHSQQYYALLSSELVEDIGVDIEDLSRPVHFGPLAMHAFHPEEYEKWQDLRQDIHYWFEIWTRKEAILKASGLGIRVNLNELNTEKKWGKCEHPKIGCFAYSSQKNADYMLSMAWKESIY